MSINHEEALQLIHYSLDYVLEPEKKTALANHLDICESCRTYTREIKDVESVLRTAMKIQWALSPMPLAVGAIRGQTNSKSSKSAILATRFAMLSMFFALAIFSFWQIGTSKQQDNESLPVMIFPNPTPSLQPTNTKKVSPVCDDLVYTVQSGDTLESIARQFMIDEDAIAEVNELDKEPFRADLDLVIPMCSFTPTITVRAPTLSTTLTPLLQTTTSTPGQ